MPLMISYLIGTARYLLRVTTDIKDDLTAISSLLHRTVSRSCYCLPSGAAYVFGPQLTLGCRLHSLRSFGQRPPNPNLLSAQFTQIDSLLSFTYSLIFLALLPQITYHSTISMAMQLNASILQPPPACTLVACQQQIRDVLGVTSPHPGSSTRLSNNSDRPASTKQASWCVRT
ncbi:hypothetical protein BGZ60DRAFT_148183 [Tricladium varicosporioides]|nr:hypothetical protein BGZ60DRAFT_148183 [Hymenoscyphus varicosporioides]